MKILKTSQKRLHQNAEYRKRNREAILYHKRNNRLRRFGLQPADLDRMLLDQDYKCAICNIGPLKREGRSRMSAHLDHCHFCGMLRKILCKRCNTLVGFIESDASTFSKAFLYSTYHRIEVKHEHR